MNLEVRRDSKAGDTDYLGKFTFCEKYIKSVKKVPKQE